MTPPIELNPIGWIRSIYREKFGTPRQSGVCPSATGTLYFHPPYDREEAFRALKDFSHLWILGVFHQCPNRTEDSFQPMIRPPQLGGNQKVGVFASRSPFRPNPISLSVVRLDRIIEREGSVSLAVSGLDLIDHTPVLDVKPYIPYADCRIEATEGYSCRPQDCRPTIAPSAYQKELPPLVWQALCETLCARPAPGYHVTGGAEYGMLFDQYNVRWIYQNEVIVLTALEKKD